MKRAITTSVVAGLLGTLGFAPAVSAEGTLYGNVRSGIFFSNPGGDEDSTVDIGVVDAGDLGSGDKLWSRIGVKASHELDGGVTAGLHIEKRLDNFRTRIQKVSLSGDFGTLALGQMWTTYYNATTIDGMSFVGGYADIGGSRANGVMYSSNLGGPFNFSAMVRDNNSADGGRGDGMDIVELSGSLSVAGANVSVGYLDEDEGAEHVDVRVSGSAGPMNYSIGAGSKENADGTDVERFGFHVGYQVTESGKAYVQYEDVTDDEGASDNSNDWFYLGYKHALAPGVTVFGELRTPDVGADVGALVLKVDF
jgi:predicted porin